MFENDQKIVNVLLTDNQKFRELYKKHRELDKQVDKISIGHLNVSDIALTRMKKEKLNTKDRMAIMIADYRRHHH